MFKLLKLMVSKKFLLTDISGVVPLFDLQLIQFKGIHIYFLYLSNSHFYLVELFNNYVKMYDYNIMF